MSDYNGRDVMRQVAENHGWNVTTIARTDGNDAEFYESSPHRVLVIWTPQNTAPYVALNPGKDHETVLRGAGSLIEARRYIETTQ